MHARTAGGLLLVVVSACGGGAESRIDAVGIDAVVDAAQKVVVDTETFVAPAAAPPLHVLFVMDSSSGTLPEQNKLRAQVGAFVDVAAQQATGAAYAVVTTDLTLSPDGRFTAIAQDARNSSNQLLQEVPNGSSGADPLTFCNDVIAASDATQRGVLSPADPLLASVIDAAGFIPDFTGRTTGGFVDADGDRVADASVVATFADAIGCLLSVGIRGSGVECPLGAAAAALDADSLAGTNLGFDPAIDDAVLAIVVLTDDDSGETSTQVVGNEFQVTPFDPGTSAVGELLISTDDADLCETTEDGILSQLPPPQVFADRVLAARPMHRTFVGAIAGPPLPAVADCEALEPVPSCPVGGVNPDDSAAPGNRVTAFVEAFATRVSPRDASSCQGDYAGTVQRMTDHITSLLNANCLASTVDPPGFDLATDVRAVIDLSGATDPSCAQLGSTGVVEVSPGVCAIDRSRLNIQSVPGEVCASGRYLGFLGFTPPPGAVTTIEYLGLPQ